MTKDELIRALSGLDGETDLIVWVQGEGERELVRTSYVPSNSVAFIHLIARPISSPGPSP